jgi:hypothetical protein
VAAVLGQHGVVELPGGVQLVQQRGHEVEVGVGLDLDHLAHRGRFDAPRVHEADGGAALLGRAQLAHRVGRGHEAHVRDLRVLSEDERVVRVLEVRHGVQRAGAEHGLAAGKLVGAVLRARAEHALAAQLREERRERLAPQRVEGRGVAHVARDGGRTVLLLDAAQGRSELGQYLVPGPLTKLTRRGARVRAAERHVQPVGVVVHVREPEPFVTGEAARHGVFIVGPQAEQPLVLDLGQEATRGLTDATERGDVFKVHARVTGADWRNGRKPPCR